MFSKDRRTDNLGYISYTLRTDEKAAVIDPLKNEFINLPIAHEDMKTIPNESFISCLCCIPRAWTLFSNDQWTRIFESQEHSLKLIKEFNQNETGNIINQSSFMKIVLLWLDKAACECEFDYLIVVAPLATLELINRTMTSTVLARTIAKVDWPTVVIPDHITNEEKKYSHYDMCDLNQ